MVVYFVMSFFAWKKRQKVENCVKEKCLRPNNRPTHFAFHFLPNFNFSAIVVIIMFGSNPNEYEIKTELASCCYGIGTVFLAKHRPTQQFVALKKIQMDKAKEECNLIRVSQIGIHSYVTNCRMRWLAFLSFTISGGNTNDATIWLSECVTSAYGIRQ